MLPNVLHKLKVEIQELEIVMERLRVNIKIEVVVIRAIKTLMVMPEEQKTKALKDLMIQSKNKQ